MSTPPIQAPTTVEEKPSTLPLRGHDPEKVEDSTTTDEDANASPAETKQRWNGSSTNIFRFLSTIYSFILLGMTDAVLGALLPYVRNSIFILGHVAKIEQIETYYNISYTVVSLLFLSPFVGYLLAALLNNRKFVRSCPLPSTEDGEKRMIGKRRKKGEETSPSQQAQKSGRRKKEKSDITRDPSRIRPARRCRDWSPLPSRRLHTPSLPSAVPGPPPRHAPDRLRQRYRRLGLERLDRQYAPS